MRILHYTGVYAPAWKWGGPPRSSANLAEGSAALGNDVSVFTTNAGLENNSSIPTDRPVLRNGVKVSYFSAHFNFKGLQSPDLERAIVEKIEGYDVVHITGVWQPTSIVACRTCVERGIPYVVSPRGALSPYSFGQKSWKKWPYWWLFEQQNCDRASAIHYTSIMEKTESERLRLRAKSFIAPNAIDVAAWSRDVSAGRTWRGSLAERGIDPTAKLLLYAGRQHHKKGLDLLPSSLSLLQRRDWHLILVGDEEDGAGASLAAAMAARGLGDKVTFLPATDSVGLRAAYSGADLFLLPSLHENFGNVAVEALACGCPVLVSTGVGVGDQIKDLAGVEMAEREPREWSAAIARLLDAGGVPEREKVVARFSTAGVAQAMDAIYKIIISK